jgi:predicted kinase
MKTRATSRLHVDRRLRTERDLRSERGFRGAVTRELLEARDSARTPDPSDARWQLAAETQRALQGAVLAYEDRKRLLALAAKLGIRAFDANLIVALVQDRARRGEPIESAAGTIALLPRAIPPKRDWTSLLAVAILIAMVADAVLIGCLIFS